MICTLTLKDGKPDWCDECQMYHDNPHYRAIALDPGPRGDKFRVYWREGGIAAKGGNFIRNAIAAQDCCFLSHLTNQQVKDENLIDISVKWGAKNPPCGGPTARSMLKRCSHPIAGPYTNINHCVNCHSWEPTPKKFPPIETRHLLYHIYPVSNGAWRWNVEQLCGRLKAFNGRKIIAVATDPPTGRLPEYDGPHAPDRGRHIPGCDSFDEVRKEFLSRWGLGGLEFYEYENNPHLREVKTLIPMLEMLQDMGGDKDPTAATLYAQAKGTTRHAGHIARTRWTEALYEIYLDHFPLAMEQLIDYPVTGAFKKLGRGWNITQSKSDWHYSGSWHFFRNAELFKRDWRKIDQFWSGIEPYPSQQFFAKEAGCMFLEAQVPDMNLYAPRYWRSTVFPMLSQFRIDKAKYRTDLWPK